jgi:hypothetical protein
VDNNINTAPQLSELVPMRALQSELAHIFPSQGSLDWEVRQHRSEYISGGAIFEVAGRLLAHPPTFKRIALAIGQRRLATRHKPPNG